MNRPFARSGHMVRCGDANSVLELSKQRKVELDWYEFLCFKSSTVLFASQHNLFGTMRPHRAKGPLATVKRFETLMNGNRNGKVVNCHIFA